ncbi:hypothetical protein ICM05_01155 [Leucobacter sp. cx-42]|uniref:hypothetical protein n=1 Tax=unclassified Leucobacter TaxID=2621730 RepID=UPI00165E73D3|nr:MULTISPECIES: hypothetical protein [unclassified Leucobacter]MBC9953256.1 hypothetical protein [Leucobacter sp. cx-42]
MTEYPTPEQVEAAAEIIWRCGRWLRQPWEQVPEPEKHRQRAVAQAALVAAAGVAPQASSDHAALASEVLKLAIKRRSKGDQYARYPEYVCFSDRYYAEAEVMRQASVALAAPVQVDEAKLAELIAKASMKYNLSDRSGESHACGAPDYRSAYIAHDVAEWLRGGAQ